MKLKSIIAALMALFIVSGCNSQTVKNTGNMKNSIVIYFSHAGDNYSVGNIKVGNTKIVADYITELTGAAQFEIVTHKYDGMAYTPLTQLAKEEANNGELPPYVSAGDVHAFQRHQPRRQNRLSLHHPRRQRPCKLRQRHQKSLPKSQRSKRFLNLRPRGKD